MLGSLCAFLDVIEALLKVDEGVEGAIDRFRIRKKRHEIGVENDQVSAALHLVEVFAADSGGAPDRSSLGYGFFSLLHRDAFREVSQCGR